MMVIAKRKYVLIRFINLFIMVNYRSKSLSSYQKTYIGNLGRSLLFLQIVQTRQVFV